jgi:hypothetical protein
MNYAVQNPNAVGLQTYTAQIQMFNWTALYDIPESNTVYINS